MEAKEALNIESCIHLIDVPSPISTTDEVHIPRTAGSAYHIGIAGILWEGHPGTDAAYVWVVEQQGLQLLLQLLQPRHRGALTVRCRCSVGSQAGADLKWSVPKMGKQAAIKKKTHLIGWIRVSTKERKKKKIWI